MSIKTSSMISFHTKTPERSFCPLVPLRFSPLPFAPSALVGILVSATESLTVRSSIMLTKELVSCSGVTTGGRCFSATETRCTASLLRCSSSRFLAWRKKEVVWQRRQRHSVLEHSESSRTIRERCPTYCHTMQPFTGNMSTDSVIVMIMYTGSQKFRCSRHSFSFILITIYIVNSH